MDDEVRAIARENDVHRTHRELILKMRQMPETPKSERPHESDSNRIIFTFPNAKLQIQCLVKFDFYPSFFRNNKKWKDSYSDRKYFSLLLRKTDTCWVKSAMLARAKDALFAAGRYTITAYTPVFTGYGKNRGERRALSRWRGPFQILCQHCRDTGLILLGKEQKACKDCNAFDNLYEPCGNCDVPGLIPEGMTPDDCAVCGGHAWVKKECA